MDGLSEKMEAIFQDLESNNIHLSDEEEKQLLEAAKSILEPVTTLYEGGLGLSNQINTIMSNVRNVLENNPN